MIIFCRHIFFLLFGIFSENTTMTQEGQMLTRSVWNVLFCQIVLEKKQHRDSLLMIIIAQTQKQLRGGSGALAPVRPRSARTSQYVKHVFDHFSFSGRSPWMWLRTPLSPQALPLPPGKASRPLLWQWVVVGVLLRSVKQHFSVEDKEGSSLRDFNQTCQPTGNTGLLSICPQEPRK